MLIVKDTLQFHSDEPTVITLGKFDGVHRGHQVLIRGILEYRDSFIQTNATAGERPRAVVFSFDMGRDTLLSKPERRELLRGMGVDTLIECPFVKEISSMDAETFVSKVLVGEMKTIHLTVGADFHFGRGRAGDTALLKDLGRKMGFTVDVVPKLKDQGEDISSTRIRAAIDKGCMEEAARLLGRPYVISGCIRHGRHIGSSIGFPTTNLFPEKGKSLPPFGVYTTESRVGESTWKGITNVGVRPTVGGENVSVETFLFDCGEDLYGKQQTVSFLHFMRPETKFDSLEALKAQIEEDKRAGEAFFKPDTGLL